MKKITLILATLCLSSLALADTMTLDQDNTSGSIVVNAALDSAASVTFDADEFDGAGTIVDVDLGTIDPLSVSICADLQANSTGGLGDFAGANCQATANDLHLAMDVDGLVTVGGSSTVDVSYTPAAGDFAILEMCAALPTLGTSCSNDASVSAAVNTDVFEHYLHLSLPLNSNSANSALIPADNLFSGDITVDITVN